MCIYIYIYTHVVRNATYFLTVINVDPVVHITRFPTLSGPVPPTESSEGSEGGITRYLCGFLEG